MPLVVIRLGELRDFVIKDLTRLEWGNVIDARLWIVWGLQFSVQFLWWCWRERALAKYPYGLVASALRDESHMSNNFLVSLTLLLYVFLMIFFEKPLKKGLIFLIIKSLMVLLLLLALWNYVANAKLGRSMPRSCWPFILPVLLQMLFFALIELDLLCLNSSTTVIVLSPQLLFSCMKANLVRSVWEWEGFKIFDRIIFLSIAVRHYDFLLAIFNHLSFGLTKGVFDYLTDPFGLQSLQFSCH